MSHYFWRIIWKYTIKSNTINKNWTRYEIRYQISGFQNKCRKTLRRDKSARLGWWNNFSKKQSSCGYGDMRYVEKRLQNGRKNRSEGTEEQGTTFSPCEPVKILLDSSSTYLFIILKNFICKKTILIMRKILEVKKKVTTPLGIWELLDFWGTWKRSSFTFRQGKIKFIFF